jgi:hypothetical protein
LLGPQGVLLTLTFLLVWDGSVIINLVHGIEQCTQRLHWIMSSGRGARTRAW